MGSPPVTCGIWGGGRGTRSCRTSWWPRLPSGISSAPCSPRRTRPACWPPSAQAAQQVNVRIVAPHGAAAYRSELQADLQNRKQSGTGLSGSNRIQASSAARKQLAEGDVNSRLMITLALMASLHPVHLVTFGDGGPDLSAAPLRSAQISLTGGAQKKAVLTFLRLQRPPYRPAHVKTRRAGPGPDLAGDSVRRPQPDRPVPLTSLRTGRPYPAGKVTVMGKVRT